MQELRDGVDIHTANQVYFKLPGWEDALKGIQSDEVKRGRLVAKVCKFRLIYGGTEHSFARDPDFTPVSISKAYWAKVIERYYSKYKGIAAWHSHIIQEVTVNSQLIMPTGRRFTFQRTERGDWPVTNIKNYPVQSLGADVMSIARVDFARRFWRSGINGKLRCTVHDSIVVDVPNKDVDRINQMFYDVFADIPENFKNIFGVEYNLSLGCELKVGPDMGHLEKVIK